MAVWPESDAPPVKLAKAGDLRATGDDAVSSADDLALQSCPNWFVGPKR